MGEPLQPFSVPGSQTMKTWLNRLFQGTSARTRRPCRTLGARPRLEALEARLAPAFDLTISTAATNTAVFHIPGTFLATGHGANINIADILTDLKNGHSVSI